MFILCIGSGLVYNAGSQEIVSKFEGHSGEISKVCMVFILVIVIIDSWRGRRSHETILSCFG